jgi:hypothetical protein
MVAQFTQQPTQLAPPPAYPNLSPQQLAILEQIYQQNPQQIQRQNQSLVPSLPQAQTSQSTTAYGSSGTVYQNADPNALLAQYYAMMAHNLPTQSVAPVQQPIQQPIQQFGGELLTQEQIAAIVEYIKSSEAVTAAAASWIEYLQTEYVKLLNFSANQDNLINLFLHDREFVLAYIRGAWIQQPFDGKLAADIADVYMELDALFPRHRQNREPQYQGSDVRFDAQLVNGQPSSLPQQISLTPTQQPTQQPNLIPPLPTSNNGGITAEQISAMMAAGQSAQALIAARRNPAAIYAALAA